MQLDKIKEELRNMFPNASCELNYSNDYTLLIAIILSAQTTDKQVNKITPALFNKYPDVYSLKDADISDVIEIIKPLGLAKNKSRYITKLAEILALKGGIIPKNIKELEKLPGVGHKTACVFMSEYYKEPHIAVDTHVFRVSNRLGIVDAKTVTETEKGLEKLFDKDEYIDTHLRLLFLGRYICKSIKPLCEKCNLKECCKEWNFRHGKNF